MTSISNDQPGALRSVPIHNECFISFTEYALKRLRPYLLLSFAVWYISLFITVTTLTTVIMGEYPLYLILITCIVCIVLMYYSTDWLRKYLELTIELDDVNLNYLFDWHDLSWLLQSFHTDYAKKGSK